MREKVLGPEHRDVAQSLHNRAELLGVEVRAIIILWKRYLSSYKKFLVVHVLLLTNRRG